MLIAKFSPGLFGAIKVYSDGRILSRFGSGYINGATATVDQSGSQRLVRDTRQSYLTISGPNVSIVVQLASNDKRTVRDARAFAATVNMLSQQLANTALQIEAAQYQQDNAAEIAEFDRQRAIYLASLK